VSEPVLTTPARTSGTAAAVSVHEPGATDQLAGPGTGRAAPPDARTARTASYDPADFPLPGGREEEWRFTPLGPLRPLLAGAPAEGKVVVEVDPAPEVTVAAIDRGDPRLGSVLTPADRLSAVAFASFDGGTMLSIPPGAVASRPSWVTVRGEGGTAYGHLVVDVGAQAEAVVVLDHVGSATFGANAEYRIGDGASLTVVSLQDWEADAVHGGAHAALVGRDARFRSAVVTLGGHLVRLTPTVRFAGPGGDAELLGLYFADAGQYLEHRLFVDHGPAHCRSRVTYKGALQGHDAHTVWVGDVLIGADANGTDTYELNRNLLLTDGARADSVPNLEIETGEITGAGHASATGRFDDEQLFYLQARGIPPDLARRLVVRGFFADVINRIGVPELTDRLVGAIDAELERVGR
jgi:Fe-S cluster assembly protein SufD